MTYKTWREGHNASVGHKHIHARLLRQNLVCSFFYRSEICVVAPDPFQLSVYSTAGPNVLDCVLCCSLIAPSGVDLGRVATRKHFGCRDSKAIGPCNGKGVLVLFILKIMEVAHHR